MTVNCADQFLPAGSPLAPSVWVVEETIPQGDWPDGVSVMVVLNPPPLDLPALHKDGHTILVLVSRRPTRKKTAEEALKEFFHMPVELIEGVIEGMKKSIATVFFLSFHDLAPWYLRVLPRDERDVWIVRGESLEYCFDEYAPHAGSLLFDDGYRRKILNDCTFTQSTAWFLRVLEDLPYTADRPSRKSLVFRHMFPFYKDGTAIGAEVPFLWCSQNETGDLDEVRRSVFGEELSQRATEYAVAVAALSEIASVFTHRGRSYLHLALIRDLVWIDGDTVRAGPHLAPGQRERLRKDQPHLYLHLTYRVPNQFLVASLDDGPNSVAEFIRLGETLLARLDGEKDLHFAKRSQEMTAMAGTLGQHYTFKGRQNADRQSVLLGKERAKLAMDLARPHERSRDTNYWIQAVLTDWALFTGEARREPGLAEDRDALGAELRHALTQEPDDPYTLMVGSLAAAVAAACLEDTGITDLMVGPAGVAARIADLLAGPLYDDHHPATYALCLAAGYATLALPLTAEEDRAGLDPALSRAVRFFDGARQQPQSVLARVGLKFAACHVWHLTRTGRGADASQVAALCAADAASFPPDRASPRRFTGSLPRRLPTARPSSEPSCPCPISLWGPPMRTSGISGIM